MKNNIPMNNEIKDLVVGKDVKCPICGGKMKKCGSLKGKTIFCCVDCKHEI